MELRVHVQSPVLAVLQQASRGFRAVARNPTEVAGGAREAVLQGSDRPQVRFEAAMSDFLRWADGTDAPLWYAPPACVAVRR